LRPLRHGCMIRCARAVCKDGAARTNTFGNLCTMTLKRRSLSTRHTKGTKEQRFHSCPGCFARLIVQRSDLTLHPPFADGFAILFVRTHRVNFPLKCPLPEGTEMWTLAG
jgi:hypothetical protein